MATRGTARSAGPTYQSVIAADLVQGPPSNQIERFDWPGDTAIDPARYTSREFAALEAERLWPNVWQMACRLEHLPEAAVATWGGFVFVHPSQSPSLITEPFEQFSAPLADHFAAHPRRDVPRPPQASTVNPLKSTAVTVPVAPLCRRRPLVCMVARTRTRSPA